MTAKERAAKILWYPCHELILRDIVRAENCRLYDSRGNEYVDLGSGVWCTSIGHGHPRILRVIAEQSARIGHTGFNYSSEIVEESAGEILALLGFEGGGGVFLCSGSEAVEYGVRVAQSVTDRPLLMTMTDSYFGAYGSASRREQEEWFCFDWMAGARCSDSGCHEGCEHWARIPFDRIGGFVFEPGSSSGLVQFPPEKLIRSLVDVVKSNGGLIIVNEVTTGVGQTGTWFGYQHYGITPDVVALGKGIGNGYPVSLAAFSPGVMERLGGEPLKYAQSHQNDPLGAAVALEVVRVIREEGLIERCGELATLLATGLEEVKTRTDRIKEIRARGLMVAVELIDDPQASFTARVHRELVRRGFVVGRRPGVSVLRLDPSLTIDPEDIERFLKTLGDVLTESPS